MNRHMAGVPEDPLPWLTERFRDGGVFDEDISEVVYLSRVLGVCQSTVNAMSDHNKSFVVRYSSSHGSAYTDGKKQEVVVGTKVLLDTSLSPGQRAAITLAVAAHEVGHVRWSVSIMDRLMQEYEYDPFKAAWVARVFNVLHDVHLEHWQRVDYPVAAAALDLKGLYFASDWALDLSRNVTRYGALINATLYPHATDWTVSPEGEAFLAWATDWAKRATEKKARTLKGAQALIEEALDYLRYDESTEVPPEPQPMPTEPDPESDNEDEDGEDGEPGDPTEGEDEGEDEDGDGSSGSEESDEDGEDDEAGGSADGDDEDGEPEGDESGADTDGTDAGSSTPPEHRGGETVDGDGEEMDSNDDEERFLDGDEDDGKPDDLGTDSIPTLHGEMHTEADIDWQERVDTFTRTQAAGRDRHVAGGGEFHKREVRIVRIHNL